MCFGGSEGFQPHIDTPKSWKLLFLTLINDNNHLIIDFWTKSTVQIHRSGLIFHIDDPMFPAKSLIFMVLPDSPKSKVGVEVSVESVESVKSRFPPYGSYDNYGTGKMTASAIPRLDKLIKWQRKATFDQFCA